MSGKIYRFGRFRLDPRSRELRADDALVSMPPKSFDCLAYLVEHRDRAVGRDELISAVWGAADVSDHSLAQTLLRARQVLGDTGAERTMIRTVPRFGHRWVAATDVADADPTATIAPVAATDADAAVVAAPPAESSSALPRAAAPSGRRARAAVAASIALALVATAVFFAYRDRIAPVATVVKTAVKTAESTDDVFVVMPVNLAETSIDMAWVRLGAMDYIATLLRDDAKRHVLPSDQVVSVVGASGRAASRDDADLGRLAVLTGASWIVIPRATSSGDGWRVALDVYHGGGMRTYEGAGEAPLPASRAAALALLAELGVGEPPPGLRPDDELLQRVDAALLVGDLDASRRLIEAAPETTRADPRFRTRAGMVALRQGRPAEAEALYRPLATDDATIPLAVRVAAYNGLGAIAVGRLDHAAAQAAYDKAIALVKNTDEQRLLGRAYMGRGVVHAARNEFTDAMADFGLARIALTRAGDRINTASLEINVGMAEVNRGRLVDGIAAFDRAIPILTSFGVRDQLLISLHNKIYAQLGLVDQPGALATSERAIELVDKLANAAMVRRVAAARARVLFNAGRLREVEALAARYDEQPDDPAASDTEFGVLRVLVVAERGDDAAVDARGDALMARVERSADMTGQALLSEACYAVVEAALRLRRIDRAEAVLYRLRTAPPAPEDLNRPLYLALADAQIRAARKDPGASDAFEAAFKSVEDDSVLERLVLVASAWTPTLVATNDKVRASRLSSAIAAPAARDYRAARAIASLYRMTGFAELAADADNKTRALAGERDPEQTASR
ncbi:winged helix-turn-helix domain-containing protein [Tahibacter soli]|uniref:Winged helix-turn-helix domain-containing protein n=1 Tax=Tahibacter soli TaxID=2983605 RepID=A0A9X3YM37_9GAMM|nr:winged helix-turn-helix domain-containing protein [Tahibacter soli]MDC8014859.1 winged helix-turn-helix domain-containing protein [Tahibacter soli]